MALKKTAKKSTLKENKKIAKTATEALKISWEDKLFSAWKKYSQIEGRLAKNGYHFLSAELCTSLNRAKYLIRRGKKKNYEYIQKYPFIKNEKEK